MQLVWLTVIVGVAAFLQTSIGFGFAIFSMVGAKPSVKTKI